MTTVFIADRLPAEATEQLKKLGVIVEEKPSVSASDLDKGVGDATILIVRSTVVSEACIRNSDHLTLIIRAGAGVNNIDLDAASDLGIYVANCPGKNAIAVAELTMGLILALDRRIPDNVSDFRRGLWNKGKYGKGTGLHGAVLGLVGLGKIGLEVAARAKAFGIEVIAWSRSLTPEKAQKLEIGFTSDLQELARKCDILSLHLALAPETRGLISAEVLSLLHDGAMVINTARAEVIDEEALYRELSAGRLHAGLDLIGNEPEYKEGTVESRFSALENVYVTHHIGAGTQQAQLAVAADAIDIVRGYLIEGKVRNWLNRCEHTHAPWKLVVRHHDKPGVIANVMNEIKEAGINVQEMENVIFEGMRTACCTIQLDADPSGEVLERIRSRNDEVISAVLIPSIETETSS